MRAWSVILILLSEAQEVPTDRQALTLLDSDGTRLRLLSRDRVSNLLTLSMKSTKASVS